MSRADRTAKAGTWTPLCRLDEILPNSGVCGLVEGRHIAVFRVGPPETERVFALDNHDPFSGVSLLSRGLIGDHGGVATVASPLYKQRFALETGQCLDDATVRVCTYPVRVEGGEVQICLG